MRARRTAPFVVLVSAILTIALTGTVALAKPGSGHNPPGNNGTVKIDGQPWDDHPNNEPHVGCVFEVDFYGFDNGNLWADVTFEGWAPTGGGVFPVLPKTVFIGQDAAGGGTDLDAFQQYDLSPWLAAIAPHPNQGYHVKLTVNADGSQGADTKHKVFWVQACAPSGGGGGPGGGDNGGGGGGDNGGGGDGDTGGGGNGDTGSGGGDTGGGGGQIGDVNAGPAAPLNQTPPDLTG
jgi:uncharacterized membrane protein YgcG